MASNRASRQDQMTYIRHVVAKTLLLSELIGTQQRDSLRGDTWHLVHVLGHLPTHAWRSSQTLADFRDPCFFL